MNNSIVDYLNSKGQASDYGSRASLYSSSGLTGNYTGSADQNIQLLNTIKAKAPVDPATQTGGATSNASMGTISIDKLQPATQMKTVDKPQDTTNYSNMIGATTKSIIDSYTNANNDYTNYSNKVVEDANSITSLMKNLANKTADTQNAQETAGVNTAKTEYTNYINQLADLSGQATSLQRESQAIPLKMQQGAEGKGITDAGLAPLTSAELRNNAIKALTLAQNTDIVSAAATGSYNKLQLAQEKAQQIIDLKYKPLEDELKARQTQYELNKDMLSIYDKKRTEALGIALENEKTQLDAKKTVDQQKSTLQIEMAKNGAPADAIARVGNSANVSEAIANATIYLRTPNTEVVKVGDNSAYLIDKQTGKIIRSFGGGGSSGGGSIGGGKTITYTDVNGNTKTTDYNGIVNTILGSGKFTKDQSNAIRTAIAQGEDPVTVIKNNAKNLLSGTNQNALEDAEASLYQLKQLDANMTAYYNAGGNTGIFKGTYEETLNRLGEVKDPKLVELASRIATNLQEYRNAISGTAYGIKEGQEIASVFPSIKNGKVLNDTLVKARTDGLQAKIDGYYRSTIGDTGLSLIKSATTQKQSSVITSKGNLSDRDYVEKILSSRNLKYDDTVNYILDQAKASGIKQPMPVIDNSSGIYGAMEYSDYVANKSKYTPL